ncbi:uncharacterized protein F5891DRAFT_1063748 [Suillus fuscotomentosus]|uniref:F-box domain-containing protein n=1 Tax=Suillus fuscotomentosus TaxID=1912939 RepID=A0AAD4DWA4_9AGAM|nr:uncharacterized protein F5891DRAFT_1063748 [Suillus fuscotomentosus]KAG1894064.1 hypothetical protein F5891DRAFT_1063748 [Suillus fuscotomentosus]
MHAVPFHSNLTPSSLLIMRDLPIEIINTVIQNVSSVTDLLQLRSLNKAYRELVTPIAFSKLHVKNSIQSAQNLQQIIAAANLAPYVREVVYDSRDDKCFQFPPENIEIEDMLEVADLEEALTEAFCALDRLPRLECIAANFWPTFISQSGKEIRESPPILVYESAAHVMMPVSCYDFVSTLTNSPLSHLSLSVEINGSLGALLPISNPTLKSLELRSPQGPYHSLETKLSSFHYPSLESLVLENTVFDQMSSPDGVEDCNHAQANPSVDARLWSSIWQRWAAELTSLRELVVDGDSGYVVLDPEWGYVTYKPISTTVAEGDSSSLQMFQDAIVSACKVVASSGKRNSLHMITECYEALRSTL